MGTAIDVGVQDAIAFGLVQVAEAIVQLAQVRLVGIGLARIMALAFVQQGFHGILVG
ncbi:hypothetical protein D3C78_1848300 [compost metagenome]